MVGLLNPYRFGIPSYFIGARYVNPVAGGQLSPPTGAAVGDEGLIILISSGGTTSFGSGWAAGSIGGSGSAISYGSKILDINDFPVAGFTQAGPTIIACWRRGVASIALKASDMCFADGDTSLEGAYSKSATSLLTMGIVISLNDVGITAPAGVNERAAGSNYSVWDLDSSAYTSLDPLTATISLGTVQAAHLVWESKS